MKTLLKRTVAVLAAVTMLLTTLPVFNAFAATVYSSDSHLRAEYLIGSDYTLNAVTGVRDLSVSGSGVEWTENWAYDGKGAHFLGNGATGGGDQNNYLYVTKETMNTLLANTNASQGFSFTFAGRRENDGWHRFLDYITGDPLQTNSNEYIYFSTNHNIKAKANGSETDAVPNVDDTWGWHVWAITVKENTLTVYRDGSLTGTVTNSNMNASWFNTLVSKGTLLLGASAYNDPGFNGYMRDFRIYDIALTADQAAEVATDTNNFTNVGTSTDLSGLKSAIATYENKLKNISNDFYTNTLPAYEAYVYANRIVDAIECGELTADSSDTIALQLQRAERLLTATTNAMAEWSYKTANAQGSFSGDNASETDWNNATNKAKAYNSLVYASTGVIASESDTTYRTAFVDEIATYSDRQKVSLRMFHPYIVMLYTGDTSNYPTAPVMSMNYHWAGYIFGQSLEYDLYTMYMNDGDGLVLAGPWHGQHKNGTGTNSSTNFMWSYFCNDSSDGLGERDFDYVDTTSTAKSEYFGKYGSSTSRKEYPQFTNLMVFKGTMADNEYYCVIEPSWGLRIQNGSNGVKLSDTRKDGVSVTRNDSQIPIYVINYKTIHSSLDGAKSYLAGIDVADYKEGGLATFFQGCDEATAIDPQNDYSWSNSSMINNAEDCAKRIKNAVESMQAATATADTYTALRNEMLTGHGDYNGAKEDYHHLGNYTTSSIGSFNTAYEAAQAEMARLATNPYGSNELSGKLLALQNAHHSLVLAADFAVLDAAYAAQTARLADSTDMAQYTTYSVQQFSDALDAGKTPWEHKTDAERADTPYTEQSNIDTEKAYVDATSDKLDKTKNLANLITAHDRADDLLTAMDGQTVYMTKNDVEDLINATTLSNSYLNADAATKREFGEKTHGASIDDVTDDINGICKDYEDGKYTIDADAIQVLDQILTTAENVDPDVYVYNTGELERQVNTVKRMLFATPVNYVNDDGDTVSITPLKSTVTNNVMDAASALLLSSLNSHVHEYTVNIIEGSVSDVNGITFTGGSYSYDKANDAYTVSYGATATFRSDSEDTAWYLEFDSETTERQTQYQGSGKEFTVQVIGNMNVSVRTATANTSRLTIRRNYSDSTSTPIQLIDYVDGEYTLPTPTALSFYNFDSYEINGVEYAIGDTITVTEDTEVIANYTADDSKVAYTVSNKDGSSKTAYYNDKVTFNGTDSTYAWLEQVNGTGTYRPFYIGQNVSFRVSEGTALKAVTEEEFKNGGYTLPTVNVRQSGSIATEVNGVTKRNFVGQIVTDGSVTVLEYGMLIGKAKAGGSLTDEDIALENSGSNEAYTLLRAKSTMDEGAHQFTIIVNGLSGDVKYRGYLIYQDASGTHNVYTDVIDETV